jgi:predicted DCC family thiol-disulfide oxidoreductase YuxK
MLKKINEYLNFSFEKKIDGTGLAIFRIVYSIILICEILQLYYFRHLIFDNIPFIEVTEINFAIPILIWLLSVLFVLFGFYTKFFAFINYLMGLILVGSIKSFEYHVFYAYMGINFFLIFMPVSKCLSFDRLREKLKYSSIQHEYKPTKEVSQIFYFLLPFVGIGLVYFDSVFYKLASPMWLAGLGSWHPSSLPMVTHVNLSWFLNIEYFVKIFGWVTILFEAIFLFFFYKKKYRLVILIFGLILHLGILIQFPIPWFALTAMALYILMVPVSFWKKLFRRKKTEPTLFFLYDLECPLCLRTKIIVNHLDYFKKIEFIPVQVGIHKFEEIKKLSFEILVENVHCIDSTGKIYIGMDVYLQVLKRIYYFFPLYLIFSLYPFYSIGKRIYGIVSRNRYTYRCNEENCEIQIKQSPPDLAKIKLFKNVSLQEFNFFLWKLFLVFIVTIQFSFIYNTWTLENIRKELGFSNTFLDKSIKKIIGTYDQPMKILFGITNHPVFSESIHFRGYNHIVSVVYKDSKGNEKWLPIINKNGMPEFYIYGSNWVNWTFRVNGILVDQKTLLKGIERYTSFWAHKQNINLKDANFTIKVKKIDCPVTWEYDFLNRQLAKPWVDVGTVRWNNFEFEANILEIEKI